MNARNEERYRTAAAGPSKGLAEIDALVATSRARETARSRVSASQDVLRIAAAMHRLEQFGGLAVVDLLEQMAETVTNPAASSGQALSENQEAVLREAGSFVDEELPYMSRPSTVTTLRRLSILQESLSTAQVAKALSLTESRIRQRATDRTLYSVRVSGSLRFPSFQFDADGGELPGWDVVAPAFPSHAHPVAVAHFLCHAHDDLAIEDDPVAPFEWLRTGGSPEVIVELLESAFTIG
jgi:hypothetical protein